MRRYASVLLALSSLLTTSLLAQTHPNLEQGMNLGKYYVGDVDFVNLFNGNLSITIPLGQTFSAGGGLSYSFVLRYNSNVWDHNLVTFTNDCTLPYGDITVTQTTPHQLSNGLNAGSWNVRGRRPLLTPGLCDHGLIDLPAPGTGCLRRSLIGSPLPERRAYSASTGDDSHPRLPSEKHSYPVNFTKRKKQREITTATGLPAPVPPGHRGGTYKVLLF